MPRLVIRFGLLVCLPVWLAAFGCDGAARVPDAQTQSSTYSSELSVRFEVGVDRPPTASVLGFRAVALGFDAEDVLGLVDPLGAAGPDQGCVVRDLDTAAQALSARGGSIDLEELPGVGVGLGSEAGIIRPFPRVYPDVAGMVAGVVTESGPQRLRAIPERVSVYGPESELPLAELPVPALPRLTALNGAAPVPGARIDTSGGLSLSLSNAAGALIELRPFGTTVAVSCSVAANAPFEAIVAVPKALLGQLGAGGSIPVSVEVARRLRPREALTLRGTRVSVEVRSALAVELRP